MDRKDKFKELSSFRVGDAVEAFLVVEHNERGFQDRSAILRNDAKSVAVRRIPDMQVSQEKNVIAICDIDKSTKQATDKKFMGAKGIGFKSASLMHQIRISRH